MVTVPAELPVTIPELFTDARLGFDDNQYPPAVPAESRSVIDDDTQTDVGPTMYPDDGAPGIDNGLVVDVVPQLPVTV